MKLDHTPAPLPVFERLGDQAAALLLQSIGVVIKTTANGAYQLRSGPRGHLTKPPEPELSDAIHSFLEQGPNEKVCDLLPELFICAALAMSCDPLRDVLEACQDGIEDAFILHQIRDRPAEPALPTTNKVIPFPTRSDKT